MTLILRPEPLTDDGFAAFGQVIRHRGDARLFPVEGVFDAGPAATLPSLSLIRVAAGQGFPVSLEKLERHPHSAQGFLPMENAACLVVACLDDAAGQPDVASLRAFVTGPGEGVLYRRGVWHKGITPLRDNALFAMLMMKATGAADTEFAGLPDGITVVAG